MGAWGAAYGAISGAEAIAGADGADGAEGAAGAEGAKGAAGAAGADGAADCGLHCEAAGVAVCASGVVEDIVATAALGLSGPDFLKYQFVCSWLGVIAPG